MSTIGAYDLHVYCDHEDHDQHDHGHHPGTFGGHTRSQAMKESRDAGWLISTQRFAKPGSMAPQTPFSLCPIHSGKR